MKRPQLCVYTRSARNTTNAGRYAAFREGEHVQERRRGEQREQQHERVHARLLRVVREERVDRAERRADQAGAAAEEAPAGPQPAGDREQRDDHREALRVGRTVAEHVDPDREQHVVERRRAVHAQHVRDVEERLGGDPDREPLVHPERLAERLRAQVQRHGEQHHEHAGRDEQAGGKRANAGEGAGAGGDACHRAILVIRTAARGAVGASRLARGQSPPPRSGGTVRSRHFPLVATSRKRSSVGLATSGPSGTVRVRKTAPGGGVAVHPTWMPCRCSS